jgi:hypothetical protein
MDGQRFDDLARLFAHSTTRRTIWRSALGFAAGWFATRSGEHVDAQDQCVPLAGSCTTAAECCGTPDVDCCAGVCTNIRDATNCGSCGHACEGSSQCCGDVCTSLTDPSNCGGCGVMCGPCQACTEIGGSGACIYTCTATQICDGDICVECPPGTINCYGGACIDVLTDNKNCGRCEYECNDPSGYGGPPGSFCVNGACVCPAGTTQCPNEVGNLDECFDLLTTSFNCGYCNHACNDELRGSICVGGECVCPQGSSPCGNLCCPADAQCANGVCTCIGDSCPCPAGTLLCNGECIDPVTDPRHCGGCGVVCSAVQRCEGGRCSCRWRCSHDDFECFDLLTDPHNCGGCRVVCTADEDCVAGTCVMPSEEVPGSTATPPGEVTPVPTAPPALTATTAPAPGPMATVGTVTLPGTGTGARAHTSPRDHLPRYGAAAALGAAITAWLRRQAHRSTPSDRE